MIQGERVVFPPPFVHSRREMAHPVLTKIFLKLNPDSAMLFAPFRCTHPLPVLLLMETYLQKTLPEGSS